MDERVTPVPGRVLTDRLRRLAEVCAEQYSGCTDPCHDLSHVQRVVALASRIAATNGGDVELTCAAAWVHDLEHHRPNGSSHSHPSVAEILNLCGFNDAELAVILDAVRTHRFRDGAVPASAEARALHDADKLDAIGAIGIARCFAYCGVRGASLYHPADPFGETERPWDDRSFSVDHFYVKLLRLSDRLHTPIAREWARRRAEFLEAFLKCLKEEIAEASWQLEAERTDRKEPEG